MIAYNAKIIMCYNLISWQISHDRPTKRYLKTLLSVIPYPQSSKMSQVATAVSSFFLNKIMDNFNKASPPSIPTPNRDTLAIPTTNMPNFETISSALILGVKFINLIQEVCKIYHEATSSNYNNKLERSTHEVIARLADEKELGHSINGSQRLLHSTLSFIRTEKLFRKINLSFDLYAEGFPDKAANLMFLKKRLNNSDPSLEELMVLYYEFSKPIRDPDHFVDVLLPTKLSKICDSNTRSRSYDFEVGITREAVLKQIRELDGDESLIGEIKEYRRGNLSRDLRRIRDDYHNSPPTSDGSIWRKLLPFGLVFVGGLLLGMKNKGRNSPIGMTKSLFGRKGLLVGRYHKIESFFYIDKIY